MRYLLLNKDIVWLEFRCERNEYLEVTARKRYGTQRNVLLAIPI